MTTKGDYFGKQNVAPKQLDMMGTTSNAFSNTVNIDSHQQTLLKEQSSMNLTNAHLKANYFDQNMDQTMQKSGMNQTMKVVSPHAIKD